MRTLITPLLLLSLAAPLAAAGSTPPEMARIPGGRYLPLFVNGAGTVHVAPFRMDRRAVTRAEYAGFVRTHPRWRRGEVKPAFAGASYLASWSDPLHPARDPDAPVTEISWFAARAYCAAQGKRLPTTDEWEFVARADETRADASRDVGFVGRLLTLYTATRGQGFVNHWGVAGLHGRGWEWTEDFNSLLVSSDSRATSGRDHQLFCAAGVIGATDPNNYPAFLRYGLRASLEGRTTTANLGFRCAQ